MKKRTIVNMTLSVTVIASLFMSCLLAAQGDAVEDIKGMEFTQYLYSAESGAYEAVKENEQEPKAFLGVMIREADDQDGLVVTEFLPGSAAKEAGIPVGSVLLTLDGKPLTSIERLLELLEDKEPGDVVKMRYTYEGNGNTVDVTLGERPEEVMSEEVEMFEIREMPDKPDHKRMRMHMQKDHPRGIEKKVIVRKEGPGGPFMHENTLDIPQITVTRDSENGTVGLSFNGVTGKVDVYLMGMNGRTIETVSYEDLQGAFSHEFTLGPGAQGMYEIHIVQGDKKLVERLRF